MLFQVLDDKEECVTVCLDGKIVRDPSFENLTKTWRWLPSLGNAEVDCAFLYANGRGLNDLCPEDLKEEWNTLLKKFAAFNTAFKEAKIETRDVCRDLLIPERYFKDLCFFKDKISEHVFENYEKPPNYDFLYQLTKVLEEIKTQKLNIVPYGLEDRMSAYKTRAFARKLKFIQPYINYDVFGTKTGRLTTKRNSFPILTLDKDHRQVIHPNNDYFIELDFNAAEIRTFLALAGIPQPKEDIHTWINENVFKGQKTRDETKKAVFAWLYNPKASNKKLESLFKRDEIISKHYDGTHVTTPFGRKIEADADKALNYIIQSTSSDVFLRQMITVHERLKEKNTNIAFCIHDSLVLDYNKQDGKLLDELINVFEETSLGDFQVNVATGKSFGMMRKIL
tara:strand:+ start:740 stop:1924 length:1185 start_codon:yes stop_codon:yes gene_type:complete